MKNKSIIWERAAFFQFEDLKITLTADQTAITGLRFGGDAQDRIVSDHSILSEGIRQLEEYFTRKRRFFNLPLRFSGTTFQVKTWQALQTIPYGEMISYKVLAERVGNIKAIRAVGGANGKNPLPILIPCHRVIAHDGSLGGYTGGLAIKKMLLATEAASA